VPRKDVWLPTPAEVSCSFIFKSNADEFKLGAFSSEPNAEQTNLQLCLSPVPNGK
jgi:hypothetical protein